MSIESPPEQTEPETEQARQPVGRWRGFLERLHLVRVSSHEEGDQEVSSPSGAAVEAGGNGNGNHRPAKEKKWLTIDDELPDFLPLGPQRPGGSPNFLAPEVDGLLLKDKKYLRALRLLNGMEPPSQSVARRRQP